MNGTDDTIRILHVDDDIDFAELTAAFLERKDDRFDVVTADDVEEGLSVLARTGVDCVVSDYDMPGRNGIEFLESVRDGDPDIPFVLFTGKGSEEVAGEAISSGVTDYLQKEGGTSQYTVLANRISNAVEQSRSKRAFEDSQERLSLFLEQSPLGVIEWDEAFDVVSLNTAAEEILGYDESELIGRSWKAIVPDSDRPIVESTVSELLENEGGFHSINQNVRKNGETIVCEWHNRVVTDGNGETVMIISQFQDVTDRSRREEQLEALNGMTRDLLTAETRESVAEIAVNAARDIVGLEANAIHLYEEGAGLVPVAATDTVREIVEELPTFTGEDSIAWRAYREGEPVAVDDVREEPDVYNPDTPVRSELHLPIGEFGILIAGSPTPEAFDRGDVVLGGILAGNVVTALQQIERTAKLRRREAELERQNERLEEFASVVSHDLRNPLNVANGRLDLFRDDGESEHLDAIEQAHERMGTLIDDLLALARHGERVSETEPIDIEALVESCWGNVSTADATIVVEDRFRIEADPGRLQQLFENLFRNAVEHGSTSSRSQTGDSVEHGTENVVVTVGRLSDGFYVEDNGPGVPEADRGTVFEAGYSTADTGTGFGLAIVKRIADVHGWDIRVVSGAEGGARFEITGIEFLE